MNLMIDSPAKLKDDNKNIKLKTMVAPSFSNFIASTKDLFKSSQDSILYFVQI